MSVSASVRPRRRVDADEQDVEALARRGAAGRSKANGRPSRRRSGRTSLAPRCRSSRPGRGAGPWPRRAAPPARPRRAARAAPVAPIEEGVDDRDGAPGEDHEVRDEQDAEDRRRDDSGRGASSARRHRRTATRRRSPRGSARTNSRAGLNRPFTAWPEPGHDRRSDGCDEPAAIGAEAVGVRRAGGPPAPGARPSVVIGLDRDVRNRSVGPSAGRLRASPTDAGLRLAGMAGAEWRGEWVAHGSLGHRRECSCNIRLVSAPWRQAPGGRWRVHGTW